MARLNLTIAHRLPPEIARTAFRAAILEERVRHPGWIRRIDWGEDGQAVTLGGPGFEVRCWYDERNLHVQGSIPLVGKLFESALRKQIRRDIDRALSGQEE